MANIVANSLFTDRDTALSGTLLGHAQDYNIGPALFDNTEARSGGAQTPIIITMYPENLIGHFIKTFYNDWYNRIHFIPTKLELGNLLSDQTREAILWNAYLTSVEVESFTLNNGDGISVTEPAATPFFAPPLSLSTYIVSIQTEGPPSILASMVWSIDGVEYVLPITGRRTVIWPFAPNWKNPVDETLEWLTYIETSFDRTEQRFAGRVDPRRSLEYGAQITGKYTQLFENTMFGWADRLFALPLWQEKSNLAVDATVGEVTLSLPTDDRSFAAGGLLVLYVRPDKYEAVEIDSVASGTVALKKGLDAAWPKGTRVYPVMIAKLESQNVGGYVAEDKLEMMVRFVGSPAETNARIPVVAPPITEGGVEVFTEGTNWGSPMSVEYTTDYNTIDSDKGIFTLRQRADWPLIAKGHEWLLKSPTEATDLRAFFGRRRGRFVPAWIPTGTADFTLVEPVLASDAVIIVANNDYGQFVNKHPARQHVLIQLRGGTNIFRAIGSYAIRPDGLAELGLASTVGVAIDPAQVRRISFIGLYRMASDAVTFSWKTEKAAVVQTSFTLTRPAA